MKIEEKKPRLNAASVMLRCLKLHGVSGRKVARILGVNNGTVSRWSSWPEPKGARVAAPTDKQLVKMQWLIVRSTADACASVRGVVSGGYLNHDFLGTVAPMWFESYEETARLIRDALEENRKMRVHSQAEHNLVGRARCGTFVGKENVVSAPDGRRVTCRRCKSMLRRRASELKRQPDSQRMLEIIAAQLGCGVSAL